MDEPSLTGPKRENKITFQEAEAVTGTTPGGGVPEGSTTHSTPSDWKLGNTRTILEKAKSFAKSHFVNELQNRDWSALGSTNSNKRQFKRKYALHSVQKMLPCVFFHYTEFYSHLLHFFLFFIFKSIVGLSQEMSQANFVTSISSSSSRTAFQQGSRK